MHHVLSDRAHRDQPLATREIEMWILAQRWNCSSGYPPYCRKVEKRAKEEALLAPLIRTSLGGCACPYRFTAPVSRLFKNAHKMKIIDPETGSSRRGKRSRSRVAPCAADGQALSTREILARRIIDSTQTGERDPKRLINDALSHLTASPELWTVNLSAGLQDVRLHF
jgi:hypothetical protein